MKKIAMATLLTTALFSTSTYAENSAGNFYVGLGAGNIDYDIAGADADSPVKFYAGYKFNSSYAVEGQYLQSDITAPSGTVDFSHLGLALVSTLPLNPKFSILGKIGFGKNEGTVTTIGGNASASDTGLFYGLGAQYNISKNLGIRAEYEVIDSDANLLTVGANYTF